MLGLRRRAAALVSGVALVAAGVAAVAAAGPASAATISGGDKGGADITVADGDVLSGTFTNVGTFTIPAGVTVHVAAGVPLSITATRIVIDGTLDGTGAGFAGGVATDTSGGDGVSGDGSGPGGGGTFGPDVHASGGGGAGYGGAGGDGAFAEYDDLPTPPGAGGTTYGTADGSDVAMGSGGGSGGNHEGFPPESGADGGAGGASIALSGEVHLAGTILADGAPGVAGDTSGEYTNAGGGAGSGGGVLLSGTLYLDGTISAVGGRGGDALSGPSSGEFAQAGGGGGGGRIKLTGVAELGASFSAVVTGGDGGTRAGTGYDGADAVAGGDGTFSDATGPIPPPVTLVTPVSPAAQPLALTPHFTG